MSSSSSSPALSGTSRGQQDPAEASAALPEQLRPGSLKTGPSSSSSSSCPPPALSGPNRTTQDPKDSSTAVPQESGTGSECSGSELDLDLAPEVRRVQPKKRERVRARLLQEAEIQALETHLGSPLVADGLVRTPTGFVSAVRECAAAHGFAPTAHAILQKPSANTVRAYLSGIRKSYVVRAPGRARFAPILSLTPKHDTKVTCHNFFFVCEGMEGNGSVVGFCWTFGPVFGVFFC
jgi:hypothetical protein